TRYWSQSRLNLPEIRAVSPPDRHASAQGQRAFFGPPNRRSRRGLAPPFAPQQGPPPVFRHSAPPSARRQHNFSRPQRLAAAPPPSSASITSTFSPLSMLSGRFLLRRAPFGLSDASSHSCQPGQLVQAGVICVTRTVLANAGAQDSMIARPHVPAVRRM